MRKEFFEGSLYAAKKNWAVSDLKYVTKYKGWEHYQSYKLNQICKTIKL